MWDSTSFYKHTKYSYLTLTVGVLVVYPLTFTFQWVWECGNEQHSWDSLRLKYSAQYEDYESSFLSKTFRGPGIRKSLQKIITNQCILEKKTVTYCLVNKEHTGSFLRALRLLARIFPYFIIFPLLDLSQWMWFLPLMSDNKFNKAFTLLDNYLSFATIEYVKWKNAPCQK